MIQLKIRIFRGIPSYYKKISIPDINSRDIQKIKSPDPGAYEKINPDFRDFRDSGFVFLVFGISRYFGICFFLNFQDFPVF